VQVGIPAAAQRAEQRVLADGDRMLGIDAGTMRAVPQGRRQESERW